MHPYSYRSMVRVPASALVVVVAMHIGLKGIFFSAWFLHRVAYPVEHLTMGIVSPSTLTGLVQLALLAGFGMGMLARLRPSDFLVAKRRALRVAAASAILFAIPVVLTLALAAPTSAPDLLLALGGVLTATVGSSIPEEIFYRGFLLIQVALLLRLRNVTWSDSRCLTVALVLVQVYFGLNHIPAAMRADATPALATLFVLQASLVGAVIAILYLQSGHLGVAIAAHASLNLVIPGLVVPVPVHIVALAAMCTLAMTGHLIFGRDLLGRSIDQVLPGSAALRHKSGVPVRSPRLSA